jgi:hypothetical protein
MSPTPQLALRLMTGFFNDHELFADNDARPLLPYLPPTMLAAQHSDVIMESTNRLG